MRTIKIFSNIITAITFFAMLIGCRPFDRGHEVIIYNDIPSTYKFFTSSNQKSHLLEIFLRTGTSLSQLTISKNDNSSQDTLYYDYTDEYWLIIPPLLDQIFSPISIYCNRRNYKIYDPNKDIVFAEIKYHKGLFRQPSFSEGDELDIACMYIFANYLKKNTIYNLRQYYPDNVTFIRDSSLSMRRNSVE